MKLDERTLYLIAVGAAITANCRPCLEHNIGRPWQRRRARDRGHPR
jgi:alkylhydroperoxidase/carboxymuconolactone decarboxylase family protein YurZ